MARKIPIGDMLELDMEVPDTSKLDQGLRGPQVQPRPLGAAGPQFNRTSVPPASPPPPPTGPTPPPTGPVPPSGASRGLVGRAINGMRGVATGGLAATAVGVGLNRGADKLFAPSAGASGPYPDGNNVAPGQIPGQAPGVVAPKAVDPSFFRDTETGRNIGNIVNAIPGAASVPNALFRGGSLAARATEFGGTALRSAALDNATGAAPAQVAQAAQPVAQPSPVQPAVRQPFSDARFESQRPGGDPQNNTITRSGNNFSGNNIREGFNYSDGSATGRFGITNVAPGSFPGGSGILDAPGLRNAGGVPTGPDPYGPGANGGITGITSEDPAIANARRDRETQLQRLEGTMRNGLYSRERSQAGDAYARLAGQPVPGAEGSAANTALQIAGLRERGETARNRNTLDTQRDIRAGDQAVTMRGQDREVDERRIQAGTAAAAARRTQANADRTYELDKAKYGTEVAEKNRVAGAAAQKASQDRLESVFRTTDSKGNNVPDQGKIASYNAALDTTLPQLTKALMATGKPEAIAKARMLTERGAAALDPSDQAQLMQLFQTREQLRTTRSMLPGGAEFSDSDNLLQFRQAPGAQGVDKRMLTPDRIKFQGGSSATPNDLSIRGGANAFLPDIGATRTDDLLRGLRRE